MGGTVRRLLVLAVAVSFIPACGGGGGGGGPTVLTVTTTGLPPGSEGVPYSFTLTAVSGTPPYTWTLSSGSLPLGLTLSAAGVISGTPTTSSNPSFTVRVGDSATTQNTAERILGLQINAPALDIVNTSLPDGNLTVFYQEQLLATGGVPPYAWTSTALPLGLTLSPSGLLTGTPQAQGTVNVTFTVTDSAFNNANRLISITINPAPTVTISGQLTFDKVPATAGGLNFGGIFPSPVRLCFVGLEDQGNPGVWFSTTYTDIGGNYSLPCPQNSNVVIYVYAFNASVVGSITVVDRDSTSTPKAIWAASTPTIPIGTVDVTGSDWNILDSSRINGAFNILDIVLSIQQGVLGVDANAVFGDATIEMSTNFHSGPSYFQGSTGYILGDRNTDSDDFDDSVIAHEYSHYLQTQFSRDDSIGGPHASNQLIDPRVALGEGMATFLGQAFIASTTYIDTFPVGASVTNLDTVTTILPGYWNEHSVSKVLWDCYDLTNEAGDVLSLPFSAFWTVFTQDMPNHNFTYLIDFMDSLYARNTSSGAAIASIMGMEGMTFTPGGNPSVPAPWPYFLPNGGTTSAFLDSSVDQQWNLYVGTDVWYFTIPSAQSVTITLTHTGEGPSPAAPDSLDIYVFNDTGHGYFPDGQHFGTAYGPATGTGYTIMQTFFLPSGGTYGVVVTSAYPYPPAGSSSPFLYSSADYDLSASY